MGSASNTCGICNESISLFFYSHNPPALFISKLSENGVLREDSDSLADVKAIMTSCSAYSNDFSCFECLELFTD